MLVLYRLAPALEVCILCIVNATLTDLRNPTSILKAADAGEVVTLTAHGKPAYELRKVAEPVDWDTMEANREDWLTADETRELQAAIDRAGKVLTHDTVP